MYSLKTLAYDNSRFCSSHTLMESDLIMANSYVELIETTRSNTEVKAGDMLDYTNEYGDYYPRAHVEYVENGKAYICERPYVPFIGRKENGIACSTSGGAWTYVDISRLEYLGTEEKKFCDWGHCGGCKDGAVEFKAKVSKWIYSDNKSKYSTKYYTKYYLTKLNKPDEYGYKYYVRSFEMTSYRAFKNKTDFEAWVHTFVGVVEDNVIWTYREVNHHPSPTEYDALNIPEDTMLFNGAYRLCKRIVDNKNRTVHTYFVWYWEEEGDYAEVAMRQNEIRKKYELPHDTLEFRLARREIYGSK